MQRLAIRNWIAERVETWTLVSILVAAAAIWGFIALSGEVLEGETHAFDTRILLALRNSADLSDPIGAGWVEEFGRDLTALGGVGVLTILTLAVGGFLRLQGNRRSMWLVFAAVGSGLIASSLLKYGFERPRPDLVPHGSIVYTASFPSGHAMMAAVTYLTLATLVARVQPKRRVKAYLVTLACLLTILVGISRIYLGVHWPTDVLAGWAAGAAWALAWWLVARWLEVRGAVEPEQHEGAPDRRPADG